MSAGMNSIRYKCAVCGDERYVQGNVVNMTVNSRGIWAWTACKCYGCGHEFFEGRLFEFHGKGCQIEAEDYARILAGGKVNE